MEMDRIVLCCVVLIGVTSGCQGVEQLVKQAAEEAVDEALAPGGKNAQGAADSALRSCKPLKAVRRQLALGPFTAIVVKGGLPIEIVVGKEKHQAKLFGSDEALACIDVERRGNTLYIEERGGGWSTFVGEGVHVAAPSRNLTVTVNGKTVPVRRAESKVVVALKALARLQLKGACNATVSGLHEKQLEVRIFGSGDVRLEGSVTRLVAAVHGSGDVDARDLTAERADLTTFGSGDLTANASRILNARVMGSGDIRYGGSPKQIKTRVMGSGRIASR